MKKSIKLFILLGILISPLTANALTGNATLSCDKAKLSGGQSTTCTLRGSASDGSVSNISAQIKVSSNLELVSVTTSNIWQGSGSGGNIQLYTDVDKTGSFAIGTFVVKAKSGVSNSNESISVNGIQFFDEDYKSVSLSSQRKAIRIPSNNNELSSLTVEGASLSFASNTLSYSVKLDKASTVIKATATDSTSKITGTGSKKLNYGTNTFKIVVTSEAGSKKTYTVNITRPDNRSKDNSLKTLSLSDGKINFQPNVLKYNVTVANKVNTVQVNASLNDPKATFVSIPGTVKLNEGSNSISIVVKAENQSKKTYTIQVYRKPKEQPKENQDKNDKSSDNNLKQLYLSNGVIDFKTDILDYQVDVPYSVEELEIKASPSSDKAQITGVGKKKLEVGENKFEIQVKAENGDLKTYTIVITRKEQTSEKLDSNHTLKSLAIKDRDINFDPNTKNYEVVLGNLKELEITALAESDKATVTINDNENLAVWDEVKIIVTSESGENSVYTITLIADNNKWIPIGISALALGTIALIGSMIYRRKKLKA